MVLCLQTVCLKHVFVTMSQISVLTEIRVLCLKTLSLTKKIVLWTQGQFSHLDFHFARTEMDACSYFDVAESGTTTGKALCGT